jgi:hypothetical protein
MQSKQIHVKATCENENRRFCISEAKFITLKQLISSLFSIENGVEYIVKYKDDENDLVTISSDEELVFAVTQFPTDLLRIVVELPKQPVNSEQTDCHAKWHKRCERPFNEKRCERPLDERRCHFLTAKRERILSKLKALEATDFQAHPHLFYKQEHLKKKLQNIDHKLANKEAWEKHGKQHHHQRWQGQMLDENASAQFLGVKKEKILAKLKALETMDLQANPKLQHKKQRLQHKLQFIESKLANQDAFAHPGCGRRFGGHGGRGYGHGMPRGGPHSHPHPHAHQFYYGDRRAHLLAKREHLQAHMKELETADFQAKPGLFWKLEHLKKKLQMIEAKLSEQAPVTTAPVENVATPSAPREPATLQSAQVPVDKETMKKIKQALQFEKQEAMANCHAKKLQYQTFKRESQGDQSKKEELEKLHEELVKAQQNAFEKKKALCEFKAKARAGRELAKN